MKRFNDRLEDHSGDAPAELQRGLSLRRFVWCVVTACGLLAAVLGIFSVARPIQAAVAIQYFEASANNYGVLLAWGTSSEQNVQSFDIFCKKVGEPDSAYHFIHSVEPKGSLSQGADYSWLVEAHTLAPGQAYCFKVQEISTETGIPGWSREACGYGVSITPTPAPTQTAVIVEVTATPIFVNAAAPPDAAGSALPTPTATPVGYSMPATPDVFLTATAMAALTTSADAVATQNAAAAASFDNVAPTPTLDPAALTATMDAFNSLQPTPTPTFTPTQPITAAVDGGGPAVGAALLQPTPSPTSLYVVATAAPTLAPVALAPVLTPWPTATPASALAMTGLLSPSAQNLTVMLLCFIFVSASGLGALGLITSVIYIRSQSRRRELEDLRRRSRARY